MNMDNKNKNLEQHDKECECKFCQKRAIIEMKKEDDRKEIVEMLKRL
ncbi:hypothetical protein KW850_28635 [Bacillus sp. sid0103]|jgi:hypothetical protein|nr:hypothetical protein [Bacillus sp. sid0103]MBV7509148.1 hypothetical protein [Bacillus sp. sid0103]